MSPVTAKDMGAAPAAADEEGDEDDEAAESSSSRSRPTGLETTADVAC